MPIPWKYVPPVFNRWQPYSIYATVESDFRTKLVYAEILKLINGTVVYRVLRQYLFRFQFDSQGHYMTLPGYIKTYFVDEDPTKGIEPATGYDNWLPI
jgi:hypothetical protein